jgi:hypothetical protein
MLPWFQHISTMVQKSQLPAATDMRNTSLIASAANALGESDIENNQIVGVMHPNERRRIEKPVSRQLEDQLVEIFGRHT